MKAGIGHLSEKLQVVKLEGETTIDPNETLPIYLVAPMFAQVRHEASRTTSRPDVHDPLSWDALYVQEALMPTFAVAVLQNNR